MNKTFLTSGLFFGLLLLFSIESRAEIREADDLLARQVFKQLLTVVPPNQKLPWPPDLIIVDKEDINAYALSLIHI